MTYRLFRNQGSQAHIQIYIYIHIYIYMDTYVYTHLYIYMHMFIFIYVFACIDIDENNIIRPHFVAFIN